MFLLGVIDALASKLARLVSKQWSERRDNRNKSGIDEVLHHSLNVLVSGWRFLIEQVALFADYPATEAGLREFSNTEAFAHAKSCFTARPLATRTVSQ